MKCPFCGGKSKTLQSRTYDTYFLRRHECRVCHKRFSTKEILADDYERLLFYAEKVKELNKFYKSLECLSKEQQSS